MSTGGFEPSTDSLRGSCSTIELCARMRAWRDLNPRPSVPKTDALSTELQAQTYRIITNMELKYRIH